MDEDSERRSQYARRLEHLKAGAAGLETVPDDDRDMQKSKLTTAATLLAEMQRLYG